MATQTPLQVILGTLEVALFFLCVVLALHSLYVKIARWLGGGSQQTRVNVTVSDMFDKPEGDKRTGPPHSDSEGK